ncbi:hypothetical protein [Nitrosopumilus sp. b1]|nr:hypothetical protein [Nitrosopumilus sp. b1]
MAKEEIKSLVENSKKILEQDFEQHSKNVKSELNSFKKKTLDRV